MRSMSARWSAVSCCWFLTNNQDVCRGDRRRLAGGAACRFLPRTRSGGPGKRVRQSPVSFPTNAADPRNPWAWISRASCSLMTALLPALAQVGQIGSEFALAPARGHALRKGFRTHRAMDHLATDVQLPGDRALAESLSMQSDDLFIAGQAIRSEERRVGKGGRWWWE